MQRTSQYPNHDQSTSHKPNAPQNHTETPLFFPALQINISSKRKSFSTHITTPEKPIPAGAFSPIWATCTQTNGALYFYTRFLSNWPLLAPFLSMSSVMKFKRYIASRALAQPFAQAPQAPQPIRSIFHPPASPHSPPSSLGSNFPSYFPPFFTNFATHRNPQEREPRKRGVLKALGPTR